MATLGLTTTRTKFAVGEEATLTLSFAVPAAGPQVAGVVASYTAPAGFQIVSASGPRLISNTATATWEGGSTVSNTVTFRVIGASDPVVPVGATVAIPVGDLAVSETLTATIVVKRIS